MSLTGGCTGAADWLSARNANAAIKVIVAEKMANHLNFLEYHPAAAITSPIVDGRGDGGLKATSVKRHGYSFTKNP